MISSPYIIKYNKLIDMLHLEKLKEIEKIPVLYDKALHYVFENNLVSKDGMWLEFGAFDGWSTNKIAKYTDDNVYGFDSFEGLPEDWVGRKGGDGKDIPKGTFDLGGSSKEFNLKEYCKNNDIFDNVVLIQGWFSDTLPNFMIENNKPISFIHLDSDIYSSAKDVFKYTGENIKNGCVIVFDELISYTNFEDHEWKAWWEFVDEFKIEFEWIGGNVGGVIRSNNNNPKFGEGVPLTQHRKKWGPTMSPSEENVAVRILNNPRYKFKN